MGMPPTTKRGQIELVSADIYALNGELRGLQKSGTRSCSDTTDLTANELSQIKCARCTEGAVWCASRTQRRMAALNVCCCWLWGMRRSLELDEARELLKKLIVLVVDSKVQVQREHVATRVT